MNVLVVGSGGREHVLAWKLSISPIVDRVYVAPGNPGMDHVAERLSVDAEDGEALAAAAKKHDVDLTVIGPEASLLAGVADVFAQEGLKVFAPKKNAARIEGSKSFAKDMMKRYGIPTADYAVFTDFDRAKAYISEKGVPIVVKADGLAAGKGVTVAKTWSEAEDALANVLQNDAFGTGAKVVLEEYLEGEEISLMGLVNGDTVVPLAESQDHKRVYDGDQGPNTGGMGAYSPVPHVGEDVMETAFDAILQPAASALVTEGAPFTGVLYAGLVLTDAGPKVIEFNARFGDPEAQVILPRMEDDLAEVLLEVLDGRTPELSWKREALVGVVGAAEGYPGAYQKGLEVPGNIAFDPEDSMMFYAGVDGDAQTLRSSGGRVFLLTSFGETVAKAQKRVYKQMRTLKLDGYHYRTDIGARGLGSKE
ncbi:phosphoribosylamine--glycine ligase [Natribacillus halophilus]|uniref:Phosphoribosylamine--glycine ligase n=1 Tax=Natribacillus halophilus TaxID=549003 RepID=A0A1G8P9F0_9BACI|nr:phosphoribosylamine--glycine ligase [Natribacillus halophilus]SDI89092.1 phosphoribosylamine--glycine ligase [Natribacillus halophilus]